MCDDYGGSDSGGGDSIPLSGDSNSSPGFWAGSGSDSGCGYWSDSPNNHVTDEGHEALERFSSDDDEPEHDSDATPIMNRSQLQRIMGRAPTKLRTIDDYDYDYYGDYYGDDDDDDEHIDVHPFPDQEYYESPLVPALVISGCVLFLAAIVYWFISH